MHTDEYRRMFELEDRYWWFVARRRLALGLLRRALSAPATEGRTPHTSRPAPSGDFSSRVPRPDSPDPAAEGRTPHTPHPTPSSDPASRVPRLDSPDLTAEGRTPHTSRPTHAPQALPSVLDLGCGTGVVLRELGEWAFPVGLDMSPVALEYCRKRGLLNLIVAKGESLPIADEGFDAVVALDILEHIPDDEAAFREAFRVLKPGGVLVLSVPAFWTLWGPHDVALMHVRRYRTPEIRRRLVGAGFDVDGLSYSIFLLFPVVLIVRLIEKFKRGEPEASLPAVPGWFNRALVRLQDFEAAMIRRFALPWGSSVVAVARKPGPQLRDLMG